MNTVTDTNTMLKPLPIDVISIQSQVVYGCVGNNAALPALRAHGLNAAAVPTVVFSNTPHYPTIHGGATPIDWFAGYLQDLLARDALHQIRLILTGYLGGAEQALALANWFDRLRETHPDLPLVVDPVIGDHDCGVYVNPNMVEAYRRHLLARARGLTPNGFELERLTGRRAADIDAAIAAARTLLTGRSEWVVVTSAAPDAQADDEIGVLVVTRTQAEVIRHPRLPIAPKGTGDLFAATLSARWLSGASIVESAAHACRYVTAAIEYTHAQGCGELCLPPA